MILLYRYRNTNISQTCCADVQIAVEAPKHERIICSDAANTRNEDFARSAFIIYDTPEKAAKSVQKLNKMRIYQNQKLKGGHSTLEYLTVRL